jgi:hypothetical protein
MRLKTVVTHDLASFLKRLDVRAELVVIAADSAAA